MNDDLLKVVALKAGRQAHVKDFVEEGMGTDGQAWLVCSYVDCTHNVKGHCDVYTVSTAPKLRRDEPCDRYVRQVSLEEAAPEGFC